MKEKLKLIQKDIRRYDKDTLITSFFATITVLLLVIIILNSNIVCHAQEITGGSGDDSYSYDTENFKNWLDYFQKLDITKTNPTGVLNRSDNPVVEVDNNNYPGIGTFNNVPLNTYYFQSPNNSLNGLFNGNTFANIPDVFTFNGVSYNTKDYQHFYWFAWNSGSSFSLVLSKSGFMSSVHDSYRRWYQPLGTDSFIFYFQNGLTSNPIIRKPAEVRISGHGVDDTVLQFNISYYDSLLYSNSSITSELFELIDNGNGSYSQEANWNGCELNYLLGQNGNGGSPTGETDENNLVLSNGDWTFTNKNYFAPYNQNNVDIYTPSIYPSGNVQFSFIPNDYQINHSDEFTVVFTFYWDYNVDYRANKDHDPFKQTVLKQKNYTASFSYWDKTLNSFYIEVPLSEFISNGNVKSWTFKDIMDNLSSGSTNFVDVLNYTNTAPNNLVTDAYVSIYSYNTFDLYATAFLDCESSASSSGNITESYNPMSRVNKDIDNSGNNNKNPYNGDDDVSTPGDAPGPGGNSGTTTTTNSGSIIIYNNNNNYGGTSQNTAGSGTVTNFFLKLLGEQKVSSSDFEQSVGANKFVDIVKDSGAFMPSSIITILVLYFGIAFSILIIAFVLRMVLDLL